MSYVEILILRHLVRGPAHGYELRKRVEKTVGVLLHNNSLYPALKRFEEAGAVIRTTEPPISGRPPRQVYALTPVGRDLLHDMLAELTPQDAGNEAEFIARVGQFSLISPDERRAVLDARARALDGQLEHFNQMHALSDDEPWGRVVTEELIRRATDEIAWIARLRERARS